MKILILSRGVPHDRDPQEGCFEMDQAVALSDLGHEVVIMSVCGRVRRYWQKIGIQKTRTDGVTAYKLFVFPTSVIKHLGFYKLAYRINAFLALRLYRHVVARHGQFDVVHAHFLPCIFYGARIKEAFPDIKLVGTEHWSEVAKKPLSPQVEYLGNASYRCVNRLITVSKELGETVKTHFGVDFTVVYNLVHKSFVYDCAATNTPRPYTIIAVGSLVKLKGFDILIKAFAKAGLAAKGAILKIIGEGKERRGLSKSIKLRGLENHVILTGQLSKSNVRIALCSADLFVLSSRQENFSVALIEATACGLPAVATLCGGVREFPVNGVIKIPTEDESAMAEALSNAYSNHDNVDRNKIRKECLSHFSGDAIGHQLERIYKTVCE